MNLSPRHQEIVRLVAREGYTYPEVGTELGISAATVKVYVQRIVQRSGLELPPRRALFVIYHEMQAESSKGVTPS